MPQDIKITEALMYLPSVKNGNWVRIIRFEGDQELERKLRQIGVVPGDMIHLIRRAPFGGPLLIEIKGREIALSKDLADRVLVSEESECASL
jgi:ferrous iron transport protein A